MRFVSVAVQISFILGGALKGLAEAPRGLAGGGRIDVRVEGHVDNFPLYEWGGRSLAPRCHPR